MGPFSSDSKSSQRHTDQSQQASDQAINYQARNSNNLRAPVTYKLAKDATLTINNGISQEDLAALLTSRTASGSDDASFHQTLMSEAEKRVTASNERAADEIKAGMPGTVRKWIIAAVAVVVVVAGVILFTKRK